MANQQAYKLEQSKRAGIAHILFLLNISLLPIISFIVLLWLYKSDKIQDSIFCRSHYRQSILANLFAGIFLIIVSFLFLSFGDVNSAYTWIWLILYFTLLHSLLLLMGVLALVKARTGQSYHFPLIGQLWGDA